MVKWRITGEQINLLKGIMLNLQRTPMKLQREKEQLQKVLLGLTSAVISVQGPRHKNSTWTQNIGSIK